jgi:hypothetical protein
MSESESQPNPEYCFADTPDEEVKICRDYEYLREAFSLIESRPEWLEPTKVRKWEPPDEWPEARDWSSLTVTIPGTNDRSERQIVVVKNYQKKPFLSLPKETRKILAKIQAYLQGQILEDQDDAPWHQDSEWENPITRVDMARLAALIPLAFLKPEALASTSALKRVKRERPGIGFAPNKVKPKSLPLEWPVDFEYVPQDDSTQLELQKRFPAASVTYREDMLALEVGGREWIEHFLVEVDDWKSRYKGKDYDKWLKTWNKPDGTQESVAAFQIDWSTGDDILTNCFRGWLKKHRPHRAEAGQGNTPELNKLRIDLDALAYLRIDRALRKSGAVTSTEQLVEELEKDRKGYALSLMSVDALVDLPDDDESLVIAALTGGDLHIRIFDATGARVVDKPEAELDPGQDLTALKELLSEIPIPGALGLTEQRRSEVIEKATSISGHTHRKKGDHLPKPLKAQRIRDLIVQATDILSSEYMATMSTEPPHSKG